DAPALQRAGGADRLVPVAGFADDGDLRIVFEQPADPATDDCVVVGQKDADLLHAGAPARAGTMKRTSVPPPAGRASSIVPPTRSARSRIVMSPSPRRPPALTPRP